MVVKRLTVRHQPHLDEAPTIELQGVWLAYTAGVERAVPYGGRPVASHAFALVDINLTVGAGEQVALVGPNGAGKSTLFRLIAGTLKPTSGNIHVYGSDPAAHICVAYVPQRAAIDWSFPVTVADVVMMGRVGRLGFLRWPRRRDWAVVRASLDRVGIVALADRQIGELSGGQQQRVFLARALAQRADLVLLDEPFSGLDAPSHESILKSLDTLREDGVTVLLATHDLSLASERFRRVILLNRRIVADGAPASVLAAPHLLEAYGKHSHVVGEEMIVTDTCCDQGLVEPD